MDAYEVKDVTDIDAASALAADAQLYAKTGDTFRLASLAQIVAALGVGAETGGTYDKWYVKFANGLLIQGGYEEVAAMSSGGHVNTTIAFPMAFRDARYVALQSLYLSGATSAGVSQRIYDTVAGSFTSQTYSASQSIPASYTYWLAVGFWK
ncbi:MAG: hypothetical protein IJ751_01825 [Oscillospiraceae bacterium]|nr:hypothetical protein [Oscillospiraceae bacterium]